jgi:hypothetical protein
VPGSLQGERRDYVLASARRMSAEPRAPHARLGRPPKWVLFVSALALLALGATFAVHTLSPGASPATFRSAPPPSAADQTPATVSPLTTPDPTLGPDRPTPGVAIPPAAPSPRASATATPTQQPTGSPDGSPVVTKPTPATSPGVGAPSKRPFPKASGQTP